MSNGWVRERYRYAMSQRIVEIARTFSLDWTCFSLIFFFTKVRRVIRLSNVQDAKRYCGSLAGDRRPSEREVRLCTLE